MEWIELLLEKDINKMSRQNKTFIELSDIVSFRLECPGCQSSITIPYSITFPEGGDVRKVPMKCPNCDREWHNLETPKDIKEAVDTLVTTLRAVARTTSRVGLLFSLEIKEAESKTSKDTKEITAKAA